MLARRALAGAGRLLGNAMFSRAVSDATSPGEHFDLAVVGGGMVGMALVASLGSKPLTSALKIAVIDRKAPVNTPRDERLPDHPDGRVSTLTPATIDFFREAGVWEELPENRCKAFNSMQVWDATGGGSIRYSAREIGRQEMGFVVENCVIQEALVRRLQQLPGVTFLEAPSGLADLSLPAASGGASAELHIMGGLRLAARLVVGADGGQSQVRELAGLRTVGWTYAGQSAFVATVRTAEPHDTAWQVFLPTGPLALLPCWDGWSNVIWSTTADHAAELAALPLDAFAAAVDKSLQQKWTNPTIVRPFAAFAAALGRHHGPDASVAPPRVVGAVGPRASFPLSLAHAGRYVLPRLALVGDAAHTVHPLAGQGVNLGFADARECAAILAEGIATGRDIGDAGLLGAYETRQQALNLSMMATVDALHRLFAAEQPAVVWARSVGLDALMCFDTARAKIMRFASGG